VGLRDCALHCGGGRRDVDCGEGLEERYHGHCQAVPVGVRGVAALRDLGVPDYESPPGFPDHPLVALCRGDSFARRNRECAGVHPVGVRALSLVPEDEVVAGPDFRVCVVGLHRASPTAIPERLLRRGRRDSQHSRMPHRLRAVSVGGEVEPGPPCPVRGKIPVAREQAVSPYSLNFVPLPTFWYKCSG